MIAPSGEPEVALGDARTQISTGALDPIDAAWFLTKSSLVRGTRGTLAAPLLLGLVIAALIVAMVVLSPSADSHFIYTDF